MKLEIKNLIVISGCFLYSVNIKKIRLCHCSQRWLLLKSFSTTIVALYLSSNSASSCPWKSKAFNDVPSHSQIALRFHEVLRRSGLIAPFGDSRSCLPSKCLRYGIGDGSGAESANRNITARYPIIQPPLLIAASVIRLFRRAPLYVSM